MNRHFGPYTVETSNEDKILYPESGITKGDVIEYYDAMYEFMWPHLDDRCLTLERYPDGIDADGFFQQQRSGHFPDYVASKDLPTADGDDSVDHVIVNNKASLVYLADQAALALHGWLSVTDTPRNPDRVVFDLDPPSDGDFETIIRCACDLRDRLEDAGLRTYVMTTGSRGLHVLAPLDRSLDFDEVRAFAKRVAATVADERPSRFTVEQRKASRQGRLYIDVGRNAYGQTGVLPYSLRALDGAPAATPLDWDELGRDDFSPRRFGLQNIRARLARKDDPFDDFTSHYRRPQLDL